MFGVRQSENCRSQQWVVKSDAADTPQNVAAPRLNLVGSTKVARARFHWSEVR